MAKTPGPSPKKPARPRKPPRATGKLAQKQGVPEKAAPDGRRRVVIEAVRPEVDDGRYPAKRVAGDRVFVEADVFTDGHDAVRAVVLHRPEESTHWTETPMEPLVNDRWRGSFEVPKIGRYRFTVEGWVDHFATWRRGFEKKLDAQQDAPVDRLVGARLARAAVERAEGKDAKALERHAKKLESLKEDARAVGLDEDLASLMIRHPDRSFATRYGKELPLVVDRPKARFSSWYELFPRSCASEPGNHGSFADVEARLPYVASMGFDVLYLPPIHPVGTTHRKGKNNSVVAEPGEPGSPWAIGAPEGGHKSIHPQLGTLEDFRSLIAAADRHGLEVALDIAFQCTPDHPYVKTHPEWFRQLPDGTIQYAENPPKKYQDIYPLEFESSNWAGLWAELASVVRFWIDQGVRIFRVDNPHTKSFPFWERMIPAIKTDFPDVIFLAEAFTRPKVMHRLAKLGFTQSYTYFTWRNSKWELTEYFTELTQTHVKEFFRPNVWPNTPDILNEYLQVGGRPAFVIRLVLATTMAASYGIYGPAFELWEHEPLRPGSEEYLNSEKYEIRHWDLERPDSLKYLIARMNRIRRDNVALQSDSSLRFHGVDNEQIIAYSKQTSDHTNVILTIVNLDPHHTQSGWIDVDTASLGIAEDQSYKVHDLLTDASYQWRGRRNYVELNPHSAPAHVFRIHQRS